jgi:hypothetical protein
MASEKGRELLRELRESGIVAVAKIPGYCWRCKTSDQSGEGQVTPWRFGFYHANLCTNCVNDWDEYWMATPEFVEEKKLVAQYESAIHSDHSSIAIGFAEKLAEYHVRVWKLAKAWVETPVTFTRIKTHAPVQVQKICAAMFECLADLSLELTAKSKPKPVYYDDVAKAMTELGMPVPPDLWDKGGKK